MTFNNIGYTPVDFSQVEKVELVGYDDPDYLKWRQNLLSKKKTESQLQREKERKLYPEVFEKLKELWLSDEFERHIILKNNATCKDCFRLREHRYLDGYACYGGIPYDPEHPQKPNKIKTFKLGRSCPYFIWKGKEYYNKKQYILGENKHLLKPINICPGNVDYYLYDLGLVEKPKTGLQKGKEKERIFINIISSYVEVKKLLFKIWIKNKNDPTFKEPDLIFGKYVTDAIAEYKGNKYENAIPQLNDYCKLYNLATNKYPYLFWIYGYSSKEERNFFTDYDKNAYYKKNDDVFDVNQIYYIHQLDFEKLTKFSQKDPSFLIPNDCSIYTVCHGGLNAWL